MSTTKSKSTKKAISPGDRLLHPKPSKYTYADLANFHSTVIAILNSKKRFTLDRSDYITVMQYICIVTNLLDSTANFNLAIAEDLKNSNNSLVQYPFSKIKGIGVISRSKKCLRELINWMKDVVIIQDLTLEMLLDEYYTKFPYALKPPVIPKAHHIETDSPVNKNKESGKP